MINDAMFLTNLANYINQGSVPTWMKKDFIKQVLCQFVLPFFSAVLGAVLKRHWLWMAAVMWCIAVINAVTVFVISSKGIDLKRRLILFSATSLAWVGEISVFEVMIYTAWRGFDLGVLLIFVPIVVIPMFIGIRTHKILKSETPYEPKKSGRIKYRMGFLAGLCGMSFAALFRDIGQDAAYIVILICFTVVNGLLSIGLLFIQKLYYMKKYNL